jgi:predicted MPP superfamily phosphohydrolase
MRFLILAAILLAIDGYAFLAIRMIINDWPVVLKYAFFGLYWMTPIVALLFVATSLGQELEEWNKSAYVYLRTFLFIAYASKLFILPIVLIDDARRLGAMLYSKMVAPGAVDPSRSKFLSRTGVFFGAIPFVTLMYGLVRNPYRYKVFTEKVALHKLPAALRGLRIVQISDIHSGSFTFKEPVKEAIQMINDLKPDIILFTGDLVNERADEMDRFIDVFDKISAPYGIYSVLGNHDYGDYHHWESQEAKEQNLEKLKETHRQLGWTLLNNENRLLEIKGESVAVIGVENYSAHPRFPKYGDLAKARQGADDAKLKLLLSHDPSHWKEQVTSEHNDIDITFSGHTHGMQFGVEIPGWIKWSPIQYVYKQWAGLYQNGNQYLYVNRGLGFHGYPGRVGILPEITCIELESA